MKISEEKISYSAICEQMPIPQLYFGTYQDAVDYAKSEQPAYRPYYIVEIVEHFEICGIVGGKTESENAE